MSARWPTSFPVDPVLLKEKGYIDEVSHDFRVRIKKMLELREKVGVSSCFQYDMFLLMNI